MKIGDVFRDGTKVCRVTSRLGRVAQVQRRRLRWMSNDWT